MFKKNSWIVALLLALSLTAFFTSCVDPLEVEPEEEYTEVALGKFNMWGGAKASQAGWAVAGIVSNEGIVAKDLGYKNDDFQKARYLVIVTNSDSTGGVDLIWGADSGGVTLQGWGQVNGVQNAPIGSFDKDSKTLKIDLKKAIKDSKFRAATTDATKILLQHPSMDDWVVSAKLLIPEDKFIPVTNVALNVVGAKDYEFDLNSAVTITPEDASVQTINWSVIGISTNGGTTWDNAPGSGDTALTTWKTNNVNFKQVDRVVSPEKSYMDYSFLPPVKVVLAVEDVKPVNSESILISKKAGKVKVRATIVRGGANEANYTQDIIVNVADIVSPAAFAIQTTGKASKSSILGDTITVTSKYRVDGSGAPEYDVLGNGIYRKLYRELGDAGAKANKWFVEISGNYFELDGTTSYEPVQVVNLTPQAENAKGGRWNGDMSGGSFWVCFKATLPTSTTLSDYDGLIFTIKGLGGDVNWKDPIKVKLYDGVANVPDSTDWLNNDDNLVNTVAAEGHVNATGATFTVPLNGATSTNTDVYFVLFYNIPGWGSDNAPSSYSVGGIKYLEKVVD